MGSELDVVVVGGGLIGSAATRHLARDGHRVAVLTSPEPRSFHRADTAGRPLASHYDEGRITRITDRRPYWADAARRSIEQYREIERASGIGFFVQRPLVYLAPDPYELVDVGRTNGAAVSIMTPETMTATYGLHRPSGNTLGMAAHEQAPAGFINPRRMVAAQLTVAADHGAIIIGNPATGLRGGSASTPVTVTAGDGTTVTADRVLLATGPYGAGLAGVDLPLQRRLRTVALLELAEPGPDLPVLIMKEVNRHGVAGIYWVPPIHYPDGRLLLKIGGEPPDQPPVFGAHGLDIDAMIADWFEQGGSLDEADALATVAAEILPDRGVRLVDHKPCVVTHTADDRPIIDWIDDRIAVAVAGCGSAGKSADAIGHDAARFVVSG